MIAIAPKWTEARVALLKHMWNEERRTASECGRILGISRCAVIGKVHRLGLTGRAVVQRAYGQRYSHVKPPPRSHRKRRIPESVVAEAHARRAAKSLEGQLRFEIQSKPDIPAKNPQTVETIEHNHCRWPYGDPQTKDFHFCGGEKVMGLPYCDYHCRRAFQPPALSTMPNGRFGVGRKSIEPLKEVEDFLEVVN